MPSAGERERIGEDVQRVVLPAGKPAGPPKLRSPATAICGSPIGRLTPLPIPKKRRIERARRPDETGQGASTEARLVRSDGPKRCVSADRQKALRCARSDAESRNRRSARSRLHRAVPLPAVEHVDAIVLSDVLPQVAGQSIVSAAANAEPTKRALPAASIMFARGISLMSS